MVASSSRSVRWGAARKSARQNRKKTSLPLAALFFIFSRTVFRATRQLTERLEGASCTVDFYQVALNTKESATYRNVSRLSSSFLGVIPSTDFLKASGVPLSSRGDVIVDKVGAPV